LDLVKEYETVLREYERILKLSEQILAEIEKGIVEETLIPLLEEKQKVANNINKLAQRIAQSNLSEGSLAKSGGKGKAGVSSSFDFAYHPQQITKQTLVQIKSLLQQIRSKAESLLKMEEKIKDALKEKGIIQE